MNEIEFYQVNTLNEKALDKLLQNKWRIKYKI